MFNTLQNLKVSEKNIIIGPPPQNNNSNNDEIFNDIINKDVKKEDNNDIYNEREILVNNINNNNNYYGGNNNSNNNIIKVVKNNIYRIDLDNCDNDNQINESNNDNSDDIITKHPFLDSMRSQYDDKPKIINNDKTDIITTKYNEDNDINDENDKLCIINTHINNGEEKKNIDLNDKIKNTNNINYKIKEESNKFNYNKKKIKEIKRLKFIIIPFFKILKKSVSIYMCYTIIIIR